MHVKYKIFHKFFLFILVRADVKISHRQPQKVAVFCDLQRN